MIILVVLVLFTAVLMVGGTVRIYLGDFLAEHGLALGLGTLALVGVGLVRLGVFNIRSEPGAERPHPTTEHAPATAAEPTPGPSSEFVPQERGQVVWDRTFVTHDGTEVWEMGEEAPVRAPDELGREMLKLRLELAEARAVAAALDGPAVARIKGRAHTWKGHSLALAVMDAEGWQRVTVRVPDERDREYVDSGDQVDMVCRWAGGRLTVEYILSAKACSNPLPELPEPPAKPGTVPDWFDSKAKNAPKDLLKASEGSSSVSDLKVHLVWAVKRRGRVLTAAMVERLKVLTAEVVEAKGLGRLLAVNGEEDHVHVALWLPVTISGSQALGTIKGYTSRFLRREFPELREHDGAALYQRGGYVGAIGSGGDLSAVLSYIGNQRSPGTAQEAQEGAFEGEEDSWDGAA